MSTDDPEPPVVTAMTGDGIPVEPREASGRQAEYYLPALGRVAVAGSD